MRPLFQTILVLLMNPLFLFSANWQNHVNYNIDVELNDTSHILTGYENMKYTNNSPDTLQKIYLLLYPNAYKNSNTAFAKQQIQLGKTKFKNSSPEERGYINIKNITVNGEHVLLTIPLDSLSIGYFDLNQPLHPGNHIHITTQWEVKIPSSFSRFCHSGQNYYITQWFPKIPVYDKNGWHPYPYLDMGEFYYEFGDYNVNITLPKNYVVGATGTLTYHQDEYDFLDSLSTIGEKVIKMSKKDYKKWARDRYIPSSSEELKTLNFTASNVVDFAWVASKDFLVQQDHFSYSKDTNQIRIWNYFFPKNRKKWKDVIAITKKTLQSYGALCGPYPYPQVTTVDGNLEAGGGMEYPMLTIINALDFPYMMWQVIGHEIGHNWFYGVLGFNERKNTWMDEGLNTYGEMRFMESALPDSASFVNSLPFSSFFNLIIDNFNTDNINHLAINTARYHQMLQPSNLSSEQYKSVLSYAISTYYKPAVGFKLLEKYVGRDNFDQAMHNFYSEWKFKHPGPLDLQKSFENSLDMNLDWLFQDYLTSTKTSDYTINAYKIQKSGETYLTDLKITNRGKMDQPLLVSLDQNHTEIKRKWIAPDQINSPIQFQTKTKPDGIRLNPELYTLESNYLNNYSRRIPPLDFNFLYEIPQPNKYLINYIPYFSYNYYDGLQLGGGIYHLSSALPKNTYLTYGSYAFKSNKFNASFLYTTKIYSNKWNYKISNGLSHDFLKDRITGKISLDFLEDKKQNDDLSLQISYLNVKDTKFLEKPYWSSGTYYHTTLKNTYTTKGDDVDTRNTVGVKYIYNKDKSVGYWQLFGETAPSHKPFDFLEIENRLFFSAYLDQYILPEQYRYYACGTLDPEFNQIYVYDRSGDTRFSPFNNYYIPGGVNLKGYQQMTDMFGLPGGDNWALGYNLKIKYSSGFIFFDAGDVVSDVRGFEINYDAGFGFDLGLLSFYFPVYISNPYDEYANFSNWKAMKKRFLVHLRLSKLNSFFGRD